MAAALTAGGRAYIVPPSSPPRAKRPAGRRSFACPGLPAGARPGENCRDRARHADLRTGTARLRAGRGVLADLDRWREVSRLRRRDRRELPRPCPSETGGGARGAGATSLAHFEPLRGAGAAAAGGAAGRGDLRRHRVLLQFGRRGDGTRHQDGAQVLVGPGRGGGRGGRVASPHGDLRGQLPRPDDRHHLGRRQQEAHRGLRAAARRLRYRPRGSGGGARRDRAADGGDHHRAGAGRGRHPPGALRASARACARWPTSTGCC